MATPVKLFTMAQGGSFTRCTCSRSSPRVPTAIRRKGNPPTPQSSVGCGKRLNYLPKISPCAVRSLCHGLQIATDDDIIGCRYCPDPCDGSELGVLNPPPNILGEKLWAWSPQILMDASKSLSDAARSPITRFTYTHPPNERSWKSLALHSVSNIRPCLRLTLNSRKTPLDCAPRSLVGAAPTATFRFQPLWGFAYRR